MARKFSKVQAIQKQHDKAQRKGAIRVRFACVINGKAVSEFASFDSEGKAVQAATRGKVPVKARLIDVEWERSKSHWTMLHRWVRRRGKWVRVFARGMQ